MSKSRSQICLTTASTRRASVATRWLSGLVLTALLMALCPARAEGPDDQYLQVYNLIQQADELNTSGKPAAARAKYQEAHTALRSFQQGYPDWNPRLVAYRLNYVAQKLAGLSEKPPVAAAAAPATNVPAAPPSTKAATPAAAAPVKLLAAGAEPRKVLRLHPKPGDKQTLNLTMKMTIETKAGEMQSPAMDLPPITMPLETTVKGVANNGDISYEMIVGEISVGDEPGAKPEVAAAIKAALAGLKGLSSPGSTSSRGLAKDLEFKAPPGANPQAGQLMDQIKHFYTQLAAPLPEEAVGAGAKWEVKTPIKTQGVTIEQTATYELVALEGERFTTRNTFAQHAANQAVQNPAIGGVKMNLAKMTGSGTGERTSDLAKLLPIKGTGKVHSESSMTMNMGGQKQAMTMKMDATLRFEAK